MIDIIKRIHAAAGSPNLNSHEAADHFTAQVAATLHFGSPSLSITGDNKYGRRRNPSNILSDDVIGIRTSSGADYFDYIAGAGANGWSFVWNPSSGGPWVAPSIDDVIGTSNPGTPPPGTPTTPPHDPDIENLLRGIHTMLGSMVQMVSVQVEAVTNLADVVNLLSQRAVEATSQALLIDIRDQIANQSLILTAEAKELKGLVRGGIKIKF